MDAITSRINDLFVDSGLPARKVLSELELSNSALTEWKKGKAKPSVDAIIKISAYFHVSTDYVLTGVSSSALPADDSEWLRLIHSLPDDMRAEYKGEIKGYLRRLSEEKSEGQKREA
jgi:transcriptional regulator with XRE-family HTH domain